MLGVLRFIRCLYVRFFGRRRVISDPSLKSCHSSTDNGVAENPTLQGLQPAEQRFRDEIDLLLLVAQAKEVTASDIKRAFRKAALNWHPDRRDGLADGDRSVAHQRFQVSSIIVAGLHEQYAIYNVAIHDA